MSKYINILWLLLFISCFKTFDRINPLDGKKLPIFSTSQISNITATSASCTSTITNDGGANITNKGVVWSISPTPTINLTTRTNDGSGTAGNYNSSITGLLPATIYYLRAYATNLVGTTYGPEVTFKTATTIPNISTTNITSLLFNSAVSGGNITNDGGSPVTARGVVWNIATAPTITLTTKTTDSSGIGSFVSKVQPLIPAKQYYVRAYATNANGTAYGNEITFTTSTTIPTIETTDLSAITTNSATSGGNITNDGGSAVTSRGVVWGTSTGPTVTLTSKSIDGTGTGLFTSKVINLTNGNTYYVRAYATNANGTAYGNEFTFKALPSLSNIVTTSVTSITSNSAISGGTISNNGGDPITARGIVWSTTSNPTVALTTKTSDGTGTGSFTSNAISLNPGTTYYLRAYATNSAGTSYGNQAIFTTLANLPIVSTTAISSINSTSATSGGNVTSDGGGLVTVRGVVWSISSNPTVTLSTKTTDGGGTGLFTSSITSLTPGQTYNVRAYATNSSGTSYGSEQKFTADGLLPSLSTTAISSLASTSASSGGNITYDGGSSITSRGVVWGTTSALTVTLSTKTSDGSGMGIFSSNLISLTPATTYYLRSYATNSKGTGYGNEIIFTTPANLPVLTTNDITDNTTGNSATSGGNITSNGGGLITARGVVWSTSQNPTVSLSTKTSNGTGDGIFSSSLTSLSTNTKYYVRAYATNSSGTTYGNEISFTTINNLPIVTTSDATAITATTAILNGNVSSAGIGTVTQKGVVWSNVTNPTISSNLGNLTVGSGLGSIAVGPTGLTPGATYYARAYATNSNGTAYGNEITFITIIPNLPTLTTTDVSNNTTGNSATSGGNITSNGGGLITARGVVWSTSQNPIVSLSTKTSNGTGDGTFSSSLISLLTNTTYYIRAYATNSTGTAYGNEISFTTINNLPVVTTNAASAITATTVILNGNVSSGGYGSVSLTSVTQKGIVWAKTTNPTISSNLGNLTVGAGLGSIAVGPTGLTPGTTYYARAYATNSNGTSYGSEITFVTAFAAPTISTVSISSVTTTSAFSGGTSIYDGGATVTAKGIVWGTSSLPTTSLTTKTNEGAGNTAYSSQLTSLTPGATYYVRAYVITSYGTSYGNELSFTTKPNPPTLSTVTISSISSNTAISGGNISSNGNGNITAKGVVWSTSSAPTISLSTKTNDGTGSSNYSSSLTSLSPGITYYVRAYATNSGGTSYGNELSFTTLPALATISTSAATSIGTTSVILGGNVTNEGGASVTEKGVVWSTTASPTTSNFKQAAGSGTGTYTTSITTLTRGTTYYVRAYAINSAGTVYGNQITFTTNP